MNYSEYTVRLDFDGSVPEERKDEVFDGVKSMLEAEAPGIKVEKWRPGQEGITGPEEWTKAEIAAWVYDNWTKAL